MKVPISDNELGLLKHSSIKGGAMFFRNGSIYFDNAISSGNGEIITFDEFKKRYPIRNNSMFWGKKQ